MKNYFWSAFCTSKLLQRCMIKRWMYIFFLVMMAACKSVEESKQEKSTLSQDSAPQQPDKSEKSLQEEYEEIGNNKPNLTDAQKKGIMTNIIRQYCQSLSEKDFKKFESLFADSVNQYAQLKNTTKEAVANELKRMLQNKKNIRYMANYTELVIKDFTLTIPISYSWEGFKGEIEASIGFDEAFNIISYQEKPYRKAKEIASVWSGQYVIEGGRQEEAFLKIKMLDTKKFEFEVKLADNGDCKGTKFEGVALVISEKEASTTETDDCKMSFMLDKDEITLSEVPGCTVHKIGCSFEGVYIRRK